MTTLTLCAAGQDGDCVHSLCPQNRDNEPHATGRSCPLPWQRWGGPEQPDPEREARECDWPEDFSHENGNYVNNCIHCGESFIGHKRRVTCKRCSARQSLSEEFLRKVITDACAIRSPHHADGIESGVYALADALRAKIAKPHTLIDDQPHDLKPFPIP